MRASAILLLYCAIALSTGLPGTRATHSVLASGSEHPVQVAGDTGPRVCTPLSGPRFQATNAVDRAEPFGGRASVALRGASGAVDFEAPAVADIPARGVRTVALVDRDTYESSDAVRSFNTRITSVNRRWLVYASSLALRRAGMLSARSTAPAPPVPPQI